MLLVRAVFALHANLPPLDGCPMFAPAYVGRQRRAKPIKGLSFAPSPLSFPGPPKATENVSVRKSLSIQPSPFPCHPACPGLPWDRSEAEWRDLRFRGPFLEVFFEGHPMSETRNNTSRLTKKLALPISPKPSWVLSGFVSGHGFSRAVKAANEEGFSPCGSSVLVRKVN
jgi:hypothetical protein